MEVELAKFKNRKQKAIQNTESKIKEHILQSHCNNAYYKLDDVKEYIKDLTHELMYEPKIE